MSEKLNVVNENLSGMLENPKEIILLPDGPDHINWIEVGEVEARGTNIVIVSWNEKFGHLWKSGWISDEELKKARNGEGFRWLNSGVAGHGCS